MKPKARLQYMHINKVVYNIVNTVPRYWNGLLNEIHVRNGKKKCSINCIKYTLPGCMTKGTLLFLNTTVVTCNIGI